MKGSTMADEKADGKADAVDADTATAEPTAVDSAEDPTHQSTAPRRVSVSMRTLVVGLIFIILAAGFGTMTWLYLGERDTVQASAQQATNDERAEQISLDYAVAAASMNYQDMNTWKANLVKGTSPELHDKLSRAAKSMEQLLIPLEWTSTSHPLVAKVRSRTNGVYVVDTFVSVLTKTTQAPDNLQSTATYSITIDSNNDWQITDVGGIGAVAGAK